MKLIKTNHSAFKVFGDGVAEFLHSVSTNDIKNIKTGEGIGAYFTDKFGKILSLASIYKMNDYFIIESDEKSYDNLKKILSSATRLDKCEFLDIRETHKIFSSFWTAKSATIIEDEFMGEKTIELTNCFIDRADFLIPNNVSDSFWELAFEKGTINDYEKFRIENFLPEMDQDYDSSYLALEVGFDNVISYNKGCYIGQEIFARMKTYNGEIKRKIVKIKGNMKKGDKLFKDNKEVGIVTSVYDNFAIATIKKGFFNKGEVFDCGCVIIS